MQAGFHIVFSSFPLGRTLPLFIRRKDVVVYRPGGEGGCLLLSLLYSFVIFIAWFLKISKAYTDKSSVCLPTQLFLDLLANFILIL